MVLNLGDYTEMATKEESIEVLSIDTAKAKKALCNKELDKFSICEVTLGNGSKKKVAVLEEEYEKILQKIVRGCKI